MVSAYDGPGSGSSRECAEKTVTSPTFAPDASWPMPRRSTTVTRRPALARSYAAPVPIAPAPITTTSVAGNLIDRSRQEALLVAQLEPRIERVPEPVAEHVDAQDGDHDGQPRKGRGPPRVRQIRAALGEHPPPGGRRRRHRESQERQPGLPDDHARDPQRGEDDDGGQHVGQDVPQQDAPVTAAERARRLHEVPLLEREDRPAHDARGTVL